MTRKVIVTQDRGRVDFSYEDRKIPILNKEHTMTLNSLLGALRKHGRVAGQVYAISIEDVEAYLKKKKPGVDRHAGRRGRGSARPRDLRHHRRDRHH